MNIEQKNLDITEVNIYSFINIVRGGLLVLSIAKWLFKILHHTHLKNTLAPPEPCFPPKKN